MLLGRRVPILGAETQISLVLIRTPSPEMPEVEGENQPDI
jgi:hypothetical protein